MLRSTSTGLAILLLLLSTAAAQTPGDFFFEDFADSDLRDHDPAYWSRGVWQGGYEFVEDGDLVIDRITGLDVLFPLNPDGLWSYYEDVSIRMQARLVEFGGEWAHFGMLGRVPSHASYFGDIGVDRGNVPSVVDGSPYLAIGESRTLDDVEVETIATNLDPTQTDVVLQLDIIGDEISLSAWAEGQTKPDVPQLSFRDQTLREGTVTIFADSDGADATVAVRWFEVAPIIPGDANVDDRLSAIDIDLISAAIRGQLDAKRYDANRDGAVDGADRRFWVSDLNRTYFGDSDLDGQFDALDLVQVLQAGQYHDGLALNSSWATGDWTGDGEFDNDDLVLALQEGGFGKGPMLAVTPVPEPAGLLLAAVACVCLMSARLRPLTSRVKSHCLFAANNAIGGAE